jgi:hypothetical protein
MAKHIHEGWSKPGDEIPQPNFVVLGGNLRKNSKSQSPPPKTEDKHDKHDKQNQRQ